MKTAIHPQVFETTVRRWKESVSSTLVTIDKLTFVQNTVENIWIDLEECELRGLATVPVR